MKRGSIEISVVDGTTSALSGSGLLARIESFARSSGEPPSTSSNVIVRVDRSTSVEVVSGRLRVVVTLPSGRLVERRVDVPEGGTTKLRLSLATPGGGASRVAEPRPVLGARSNLDWLSALIGPPDRDEPVAGTFHPMELQAATGGNGGRPAEEDRVAPATVVARRGSDADAVWRDLATGVLPFPDDPTSSPVDGHGDGFVPVDDLHRPPSATDRIWFTTTSARGDRRAGIIPTGIGESRTSDSRLKIRDQADVIAFAVQDPDIGGLFDYFRAGRMVAASDLLEVMRRDPATRAKLVGDAVSSCMAGYIDLAVGHPTAVSADTGGQGHADACVIRAKGLLMADQPGTDNLGAALVEAKRAYHSGVPLFGVGLSHLREVLEVFVDEDGEAAAMASAVSRVADRVDAAQPFTVLRYGAARGRAARGRTASSSV